MTLTSGAREKDRQVHVGNKRMQKYREHSFQVSKTDRVSRGYRIIVLSVFSFPLTVVLMSIMPLTRSKDEKVRPKYVR